MNLSLESSVSVHGGEVKRVVESPRMEVVKESTDLISCSALL
jgi:hypothetical protein